MVVNYGMSDRIGPIDYDGTGGEIFLGRDFSANKGFSDRKAAEIDDEIHRIINDGYVACEKLLSEHMDQLTRVAEYLLRNETIDGEVFCKLYNGEDVPDRIGGGATEEELKAAAPVSEDKPEPENDIPEQELPH